MLDQAKVTVEHRRGPRQRGIIGALIRAKRESGMGGRWSPCINILSGLVLAILCDAFVAHMLSVNYWETYRATEAANGDLARALEEYMLRNMQGVDLLLGVDGARHEAADDRLGNHRALHPPSRPGGV